MKDRMNSFEKRDIAIVAAVVAVFVAAAVILRHFLLAASEAAVFLVILLYFFIAQDKKEKLLKEHIENITYRTENAKSSTLQNFPLPISVFRLEDTSIIWGNEKFFAVCGEVGSRLDAKIRDLVPHFSAKWLEDGAAVCPELIEIEGRKYRLHGNTVNSTAGDTPTRMGICYWLDVTEYDDLRTLYNNTRLVAGVVVIDNLDEMTKNQPERVKNDIRDAVEDRLNQWCEEYGGIIRRYDRDRYIVLLEKQDVEHMKQSKFPIIEEMHQVESPTGIAASISIGFGLDGDTLHSTMQFADVGIELALSRGGDQTVIKDASSFEFFGGRGFEVEKRTKVKSRVMANTLAELMRDSSRVIVTGHIYSDLDSVGAAVGVCALARFCGAKYSIAVNTENTAALPLIEKLRLEAEYRDTFITGAEAKLLADARTLLVIVDTSRPEQIEEETLMEICDRVAVIDHHRIAATYIRNAALGFIEPYASSTCELITEILQEKLEGQELLKCEAEAILSGIVLDTKSFTLRTGERTFDAAAYLRRAGADTVDVKKLLQTDIDNTIARYKILQSAGLYRGIAVAFPQEAQSRVVAAQAADELLNISGVDASIVAYPDGQGNIFASARSIGEINVQIIAEKLGGGGNRSAAAVQLMNTDISDAVKKIYEAIDEYMG